MKWAAAIQHLNDENSFNAANRYVIDGQGQPMEVYDGRDKPHEPEA